MADVKHSSSGFERHSRDRRHAEHSKDVRHREHDNPDKDNSER